MNTTQTAINSLNDLTREVMFTHMQLYRYDRIFQWTVVQWMISWALVAVGVFWWIYGGHIAPGCAGWEHTHITISSCTICSVLMTTCYRWDRNRENYRQVQRQRGWWRKAKDDAEKKKNVEEALKTGGGEAIGHHGWKGARDMPRASVTLPDTHHMCTCVHSGSFMPEVLYVYCNYVYIAL